MISMLTAIPLAKAYVESPAYKRYGLTLASRLPIRLPTGWRFPYDSFAGPFRVRSSMLILFVTDDGTLHEEWNDFTRTPHQGALEALYDELANEPLPTLPPLQTVLPQVMAKHPQAIIESVETVWAINEVGNPNLYWRIGLIEGVSRYVMVVGRPQDEIPHNEAPYLQRTLSSMSAAKWDLGRARFRKRSGNLTIKISDLLNVAKDQEHLRSQWTVWCCMAQAAEFVEGLGYGEFGPHNVRIEYLASDSSVNGAAFDTVRGVPTISFLRGGGWAEALSIVLHELGHALWSLLYTRPPQILDKKVHSNELKGIQEGFCDYFAAAILADNNKPALIGQELSRKTADSYKLPRLINGRPFHHAALGDMAVVNEHLIGQQWANFLFAIRLALQKDKMTDLADALIIQAHIKPQLPPGGVNPVTPMNCYLASLHETAVLFNAPPTFTDKQFWQTLAHDHQII